MTIIEKDTVARVHYTGTLPATGEVFDSSEGRDPLAFLVGHKQMISGFEEELMGARTGDKRTFILEPERAYGPKIPEAIQQIPTGMFGDITPEIGMTLMSDVGAFRVVSVDGELITADFNHKLAGETLQFSVEVIEVREATKEEVEHGHAHGPGGVEH